MLSALVLVAYAVTPACSSRSLATYPGKWCWACCAAHTRVHFFHCAGNFLNGTLVGKGGVRYQQHAGLALETQSFPNSINEPNFPSIVLHSGQEYRHVDEWHFHNQH